MRNPQGQIVQQIARVGEHAICTSIIVAVELRFGAANRGSERLTAQLKKILGALDVQAFDAPADLAYGRLRIQLEAAGLPIGGNDMLIAAHAPSTGSIIVTDNQREFQRVADLQIENWLR